MRGDTAFQARSRNFHGVGSYGPFILGWVEDVWELGCFRLKFTCCSQNIDLKNRQLFRQSEPAVERLRPLPRHAGVRRGLPRRGRGGRRRHRRRRRRQLPQTGTSSSLCCCVMFILINICPNLFLLS